MNKLRIPFSVMAKKTEETKQQAPEAQMVKIPHEYLIEGVKQAVEELKKKIAQARKKYGNRYNWKNVYEEFGRRFGYNDPERIWEEFHLISNKQSKQPSTIREVIKLIGEMARYSAISRMREDLKKEKPAEEK